METETVLHTALFSGILGFLVFCASYALHVWRSRNAANRGTPASASRRLVRWAVFSMGLGCGLMLVSAIWREVKPREGILAGNGLYTVRAQNDLKVKSVTSARTVVAGEVLATFSSPQRQAELTEIQIRQQILQAQKQIVELQPLTPDGELVRCYEKCLADQRQLLASLTSLLPEHALILREKLRDSLDKTERINSLTTRIEDTRRELDQATARLALARINHDRLQRLSSGHAAARTELDETSAQFKVLEVEESRLQNAMSNLEIERKHLQQSMPAFAACTSRQAEDIGQEMARAQERLTATGQELAVNSERLAEDRRRAELLRARMLAQLELEIQECQAKLSGIQELLTIKAPYEGAVAYADPAPGMALPIAPVVVLAPQQGFRFKLRMSEAEARPLAESPSVLLGLVAPILHRQFPGKLLRWERLPHEPGYVLAELACSPPPETIHELAAHDWGASDRGLLTTLRIRLLWKPPISASPLFYPGCGLMGLGLVALCAGLVRGLRSPVRTGAAQSVPSTTVPGSAGAGLPAELISPLASTSLATGSAELESGALGRNLQVLGQRLRESIRRQAVDPTLLSALEWAIDRHHTRAIEHLASGLDHDPDLPGSLSAFLGARAAVEDHAGGSGLRNTADRVRRIVEAVAPELLQANSPLPAGPPRGPRSSPVGGAKARGIGSAA